MGKGIEESQENCGSPEMTAIFTRALPRKGVLSVLFQDIGADKDIQLYSAVPQNYENVDSSGQPQALNKRSDHPLYALVQSVFCIAAQCRKPAKQARTL